MGKKRKEFTLNYMALYWDIGSQKWDITFLKLGYWDIRLPITGPYYLHLQSRDMVEIPLPHVDSTL